MTVQATPLDFLDKIYEEKQKERRGKYGEFIVSKEGLSDNLRSIMETIERDGIIILKSFANKAKVKEIADTFNKFLQTGINLSAPRDLSQRKNNELYTANLPRLSQEELLKGVDAYRFKTDNVQMKDALNNCPAILDLALDDCFLDLSSAYMESFPGFTYAKVVRNFANDIEEFDTQCFHIDEITPRLLKVFIYLTDTDINSGPFTYVRGSHKQKAKYWGKKIRFTEEEMKEYFGAENIIPCVGNYGDVVIADTTGFHRGMKPKMNDRMIIILNYLVHNEYSFNYKVDIQAKLKRSIYETLSLKQRAACDLLEIVD